MDSNPKGNAVEDQSRVAFVRVSQKYVVEKLGFPEGTEILAIDTGETWADFRFLVRHPDLYLIEPGCAIPFVNPTWTEHLQDFTANHVTVRVIEFDGWGKG